jgi:hypothetical protein
MNRRVVNNELRIGIGILVPNVTIYFGIFLEKMRKTTKNLGIAGPLA